MTRIVLAYPSDRHGADGVAWLADMYGAEVVVLLFDFGQGRALEAKRDEALAAGAVRAHVFDVADAFANRFWLRALKAGALYWEGRALTDGLGCALWAEKLVEVAAIEQTNAIAHARRSGDDRLSIAARSLNPDVRVVSLPEHAAAPTGPRAAALTAPAAHPPEPAFVDIAFTTGAPTAVNGIPMPLVDLLATIDMIARAHGVGRYGDFETPASAVLHAAHGSLCRPGEDARSYVDLIDRGLWFSPDRRARDAAVDERARSTDGEVRVRLFEGDCEVLESHVGQGTGVLRIAAAEA
jgi:argininosuccinate synthase